MANPDTKQKPGCAKKIVIGLGCGCVYPLVILLFLAGISWYYFAEAVAGIMQPVQLPDFYGPTQEHFWSLQDKRLNHEGHENDMIELTPAEFNAWLAGYSLPPKNGYCLHKIRFKSNANGGTFFLIGSGFMLRSLVFSIEVKQDDGKIEATRISINNWELPKRGFFRKKFEEFLCAFFNETEFPEIYAVKSGKLPVSFERDKIFLSDKLLKGRP
ncbi:MAG: hypothetical protein Kow0029_11230 [Candidatus Rifleibacteriota bacterium]